jgi:enoyl-CoA hydratase/carnithine racemase
VWTGSGKFFSNGLDLDRFAKFPHELGTTAALLQRLFSRILLFPAYTACALNGHAFAAGAMLSCTTDYRVMRSDRGYWCLNEADLGLPLTDAMAALVMGRLPPATAREAMLTARRFDASSALAAGIVDAVADHDDVLPTAMAHARHMLSKSRPVIAIHKRQALSEVAARIDAATTSERTGQN